MRFFISLTFIFLTFFKSKVELIFGEQKYVGNHRKISDGKNNVYFSLTVLLNLLYIAYLCVCYMIREYTKFIYNYTITITCIM